MSAECYVVSLPVKPNHAEEMPAKANPQIRTLFNRCIGCLDIITLLNGVKLYDDHEWSVANFFFRVLFVLYNYGHLIKNIYFFEFNAENMRKIIYITVHLIVIISHHYFLVKRSAIRSLYKNIKSMLSASEVVRLSHFTRRGLSLWIGGVVWGILSGFFRWYRIGTSQFLEEEYLFPTKSTGIGYHAIVLCDLLFFNIMTIGWYLGCIVIYAYLLYAIGSLNKIYFEKFASKEALKKTCNFVGYFRGLRVLCQKISSIMADFDDLFSIQPFLWFVCLFIECSLTLILFKYEYDADTTSFKTVLVDNWSLWVLRFSFVAGTTLIVNSVSGSSQQLSRDFITMLLQSPKYDAEVSEVNPLILEIKDSVGAPLTCWGTFKFSKMIILQFVGAVIPFSVLVLDLMDTVIKVRPQGKGE